MASSSSTSDSVPACGPETSPTRQRVVAVDALRGFDMFWIVGGEQVARALEGLGWGGPVSLLATQLQHVEWEGLRFYDVIFPLFLFLVGVSITLSMNRQRMEGNRGQMVARILRRSLLLFVIGIFFYGGLSRSWPDVALSGVLHRIAICYLAAALLHVFLPRRGIVIAAVICLFGYWGLLALAPFPDVDLKHPPGGRKVSQSEMIPPATRLEGVTATISGVYEEGRNLTHYVDYRWLPGKKRNLNYTNEGLLSTIPSIATTLFGIMAGWVLASGSWSPRKKAAVLLGAGAAGIALGLLWGQSFPLIKRIWTSSFALTASGWSAVLLGIFYLVVDVWRWQRWCIPFLWIGTNALTIYIATNIIDFQALAERFAGGNVGGFLDAHLARGMAALVIALLGLLLPVLVVRFLHHQKIFIRL